VGGPGLSERIFQSPNRDRPPPPSSSYRAKKLGERRCLTQIDNVDYYRFENKFDRTDGRRRGYCFSGFSSTAHQTAPRRIQSSLTNRQRLRLLSFTFQIERERVAAFLKRWNSILAVVRYVYQTLYACDFFFFFFTFVITENV